MSVRVSVITLTWNSLRYIERMIESVLRDATLSEIETEIIVVDNGSSDGTFDLLKQIQRHESRLSLIGLDINYGTTVSRNIGIKESKGDFVFILDSDTLISPGAIQGLISAFDEINSPNIGIIHPRLVFPNGEFQESARRFPTFFTKLYRFFSWEQRRVQDESLPAVVSGEITPVDYAISAAWFVKRDLFEQIGYLDEKIFFAPEDAEFCARCWEKGFEVWYYPRVEITHHCQQITRKKIFDPLTKTHLLGLLYFWRKYDLLFSRRNFYSLFKKRTETKTIKGKYVRNGVS